MLPEYGTAGVAFVKLDILTVLETILQFGTVKSSVLFILMPRLLVLPTVNSATRTDTPHAKGS